ncbi:hypothetical protein [Actinopolymorpha pittospori]|uniref:Phosphoglycerol transferase MdoB-like AlkP superfamily enzyme n=1 Tax=Actinopolymorpha pittospori TaxID=648752 RepID=A0A927MX60_9ACTN|nr:hypothetical protein [Actinopolymorpha pittospori]MBE1607919.1 phosphoglycerol transferase MdoB-like AlkP superfamily enzyme [Actinopolymorpha pittospori]
MSVNVTIDIDTVTFWVTVLLLAGSLVTAVWNIVLPFRSVFSSPIGDFARMASAVTSGLAFVLSVVLLVLGNQLWPLLVASAALQVVTVVWVLIPRPEHGPVIDF